MIAARGTDTVAGVAVQSGNLEDRRVDTGEHVTVDELIRFAEQDLRLDYLFWGTQEPFYSANILPTLRAGRP